MRFLQDLRVIYETAWTLSKNSVHAIVLMVQIFYIVLVGKYAHITPKALTLYFRGTPFVFYINSRVDLAAVHEIFVKKEYDFTYTELLGKKPEVILDLGANIGDSSVFYALQFPHAKIYAIEPNPAVHEKLRKNVAAFPNVQIRTCALSNQTKKTTFYVGDSHLGSSTKQRKQNTKEIEVEMCSFTDFVIQEKLDIIDILKFDIEGGEEDLLKDPSIRTKVHICVGEMHDDLTRVPTRELLDQIPAQVLHVYPLTETRNITVAKVL